MSSHGFNSTEASPGRSCCSFFLSLGVHLHSTVATRSGLALRNRLQSPTTGLHALAVNARCALVAAGALLAGIVDVDDVEGVDVAGDVSVGRQAEKC